MGLERKKQEETEKLRDEKCISLADFLDLQIEKAEDDAIETKKPKRGTEGNLKE